MGTVELKWPNWIGVVAEDLEAQRRFYRDVLGLKELDAADGWVQFDMGWPNMLEVIQRTDDPQYDRPRFQAGFAVEDIRAAREAMIARGATPLTEIEGSAESGGYWCYFTDPEDNVFEISQRVGDSWP
jgi:predicted enzyme related to lactoylglutathione lyase